MSDRLHANNGCTCDWCAPTPEGKAEAVRIGAAIEERNDLFDQWRKLDPETRPAFHAWADLRRSERRARGLKW